MTIKTEYLDHSDAGFVVRRTQNVAGIVDYAKARHNEGFHGEKDFKLKMVLPAVVVEHYCNVHKITLREWIQNPEHAKRMFNSPEFSDLRVAPGAM
jgi:hypothetical protein